MEEIKVEQLVEESIETTQGIIEKMSKYRNYILIALAVILVIVIGYFVYKYFFEKKPVKDVEKFQTNKENVESLLEELNAESETGPPVNVENTELYPYFDIQIGDSPAGKIVFQMFDDDVPKTCRNFRHLCGKNILNNSSKPSYQNTPFHRIIKDFMIQGGDITNGDGTGGFSIYGNNFEDENLDMKHNQPGLLSMANAGPGTNSSQFFILTKEAPWLDGKHVVFGIVLKGMDIVKRMEEIETDDNDKPLVECKIIKSGLMTKKEYENMNVKEE